MIQSLEKNESVSFCTMLTSVFGKQVQDQVDPITDTVNLNPVYSKILYSIHYNKLTVCTGFSLKPRTVPTRVLSSQLTRVNMWF